MDLTAPVPAVVVATVVVEEAAVAVPAEPMESPIVARRVGSPFAASSLVPPRVGIGGIPRLGAAFQVAPTEYAVPSPAVGGAIASAVLGGISLGACFFTAGALFSAALGLAMGLWGLRSHRPWSARTGIILCCAALAIGAFVSIVRLYEYEHGYKPWNRPAAVEEELDDFGVP